MVSTSDSRRPLVLLTVPDILVAFDSPSPFLKQDELLLTHAISHTLEALPTYSMLFLVADSIFRSSFRAPGDTARVRIVRPFPHVVSWPMIPAGQCIYCKMSAENIPKSDLLTGRFCVRGFRRSSCRSEYPIEKALPTS